MNIKRVIAVYYSATGNTEKVVLTLAKALTEQLGATMDTFNYTLPAAREGVQSFGPENLVVFGSPVYAGRLPNKLLPYVQTGFTGNGAMALPVVTFGNRNFDNGLAELCHELEEHGFHTVGGAGVPTEHVFSSKLATGRPNEADIVALKEYAETLAGKIKALEAAPGPIAVRGEFPAPYYTPLGTDGKPAVFLKAKPVTDADKCDKCGVCAQVCPVGSIPAGDVTAVNGVCIKCQACIKKCHTGAKHFEDAAFLSHVAMLEQNYTRPTEAEFFL